MKPLKSTEGQLKEKLEGEGWKVVHKGWPDFACVRNGEMMFVEVKKYRGEMLKREQHYILTTLAKLGLNCYKWTPGNGFEQIMPDLPFVIPDKKIRKTRSYHKLTVEEKLARLSPERQEEIRRLEEQGKTIYL